MRISREEACAQLRADLDELADAHLKRDAWRMKKVGLSLAGLAEMLIEQATEWPPK